MTVPQPHPPRPSPPPSPSTHASSSPRQPSSPMSSTAILPPSSVPHLSAKYTPPLQPEFQLSSTAGVKRHQSLTQGYGANSRVRDRLERSPAVLTLEQRRLRDAQRKEDEPPTSPVGPSVWSSDQGQRADDGWKQALPQRNLMAMIGSQQSQLHDSFEAMHLRSHSSQPSVNGLPPSGRETPVKTLSLVTDSEALLPSQSQTSTHQQQNVYPAATGVPPTGYSTDASSSVLEPSWLTSLIGGGSGYMPGNDRDDPSYAQRAALTSIGDNGMGWAERDALLTAAGLGRPGQPNVPWTGAPNMSFHYQQQLPPGMMMRPPQQPNAYAYAQQRGPKPIHHFGVPPGLYHQQSPAEVPADQQNEVIQLAKAKGLNPATFDCRPTYARFFVIKVGLRVTRKD